jgi:predicted SAM-dependent methyltransferase
MVSHIVAEHVFEHIDPDGARRGLSLCRRYMPAGGRIRIAVPDGYNPNETYIENVEPGGCGPGAQDHRVLYNCDVLGDVLREAGFDVELKEWHDRGGSFHRDEWDPADGFIFRSERFGTPNKSFPCSHLSLIVDGVAR